MDIMPKTKRAWGEFILFPFKAYTVIAFPCSLIIDSHMKADRIWSGIVHGYFLTGIVLLIAGLIQKIVFKSITANSSFKYGIVALVTHLFYPVFIPASR